MIPRRSFLVSGAVSVMVAHGFPRRASSAGAQTFEVTPTESEWRAC